MVDNANIQKNADFARNPVVFPQNTPPGSSTLVCPFAAPCALPRLKAVCSSFVLRLYSVLKTKNNRRTNGDKSKKNTARGKGAAKGRRSGIGRGEDKKKAVRQDNLKGKCFGYQLCLADKLRLDSEFEGAVAGAFGGLLFDAEVFVAESHLAVAVVVLGGVGGEELVELGEEFL